MDKDTKKVAGAMEAEDLKLAKVADGKTVDLYNFPDVISTGAFPLGARTLDAGPHRLTLEIVGTNPAAAAGGRLGMDYLRLTPK